jgi:thioesterase domain-containing protein
MRARATDGIELRLQNRWALFFPECVEDVRVDFFECGHNSVLALRLLDAISEEFSVQVSLEQLTGHASVARMAELLRSPTLDASPKCLIPLATPEVPTDNLVVCLHPLPGTVVRYVPLAKQLAHRGATVYGIQASGLEPRQPIDKSIAEMAERYIELLDEGPFSEFRHVTYVGYSLGALLAWELVRAHPRDQLVSDLVVIDAEPVDTDGRSSIQEAIHNLVVRSLGLDLDTRELELLSRNERVDAIMTEGLNTGRLGSELGAARLRRLLEVLEVNSLAASEYVVEPAPSKIKVVRTRSHAPSSWQHLGDLSLVYEVDDVDHNSIMEVPSVRAIAKIICP